MNTPAMNNLLAFIRKYEAPAGYNQRFAEAVPKKDLSKMTFDEVIEYGRWRVTIDGKQSSAIGGYQFITKTLRALRNDTKENFTGTELFTPEFQDKLAIKLMEGRGLNRYMNGTMTAEAFCNELAKEWASLPVVTSMKGASRMVVPGQSYYAGDGLNAAHHKPEVFLAVVKALKDVPVIVFPPDVPPPVQQPTPPTLPPVVTPLPDVEPTPTPVPPEVNPYGGSTVSAIMLAVIVLAVVIFFLLHG